MREALDEVHAVGARKTAVGLTLIQAGAKVGLGFDVEAAERPIHPTFVVMPPAPAKGHRRRAEGRAINHPWWRIGAAYSILLLFLSYWVWSGYWAACRAVLPMTIAFNLLLPPNRFFWPLWILGNLTLLHGVWRFL